MFRVVELKRHWARVSADSWRAAWANAFAIDPSAEHFSESDQDLIDRLARFIAERGMTTPALLVLETGRPLNFIGSQVLAFLSPFLTLLFSSEDYDRFIRILERRGSIDRLVEAIERRHHG